MAPRKNSSKPPGKSKMEQKSSKTKAKASSDSVCLHESTSSSSSDESGGLKKASHCTEIISSKISHNQIALDDGILSPPYRITSYSSKKDHVDSGEVSSTESENNYLLSEDESDGDERSEIAELSGLLSQLNLQESSCSLSNAEVVNTPDKSENSPKFQSTSGVSSIAPSLDESHFTDDESVSGESCASSLSKSTYESSSEKQSDGTCGSRSEASVLPAEIPTKEEAAVESIPKASVELSKPPVVSFYIPRENVPPKTKDAAKQSLTPFQRINRVSKSKLFSNILTDDTTWKLKQLMKVWDSIKDLTNIGHSQGLKSLGQPVLINLKLVELRHYFVALVAGVSDFRSCSTLFDILDDITLSKFEYHKTEVMMEVATPKFMNTLQDVVDGFHTHRPNEEELARFVENLVDIYGEIFLQLDNLATDGLAADLGKVIDSCLKLFRNADDNSHCPKYLNQLLLIISSRDSLIRANSCFPYDILREECVAKNIIDGPFDNFDQYLSIHYRLLKEDFQNSLREGIIQYLKTLFGRCRRTINYHLTVFPRVTLMCNLTKYTMKYKIVFHDPVVIQRLQDPATRSFLSGALLLLTPCISSSNPTPFEYYYMVRVEDSSPLEREKSYIFVSMILGPPNFTDSIQLMMAEPSRLFEPYYRVLNVIRSLDSNRFPFIRYIVEVKTDVLPPAYMTPTTKLKIGNSNCSLWEDGSWPNPEDVELNQVQLDGLKLALRSELAIIQGPPGTGKTYLSQKIVEVLLQNKNVWHKNNDGGAGLILVVCFKNQSLDQLLGGLVKAGKKVLRVGTQSREEMLDEYNLKTLECPKHSQIYFRMRKLLGKEQLDLMDELAESIEVVRRIENLQGLIKLDVLSTFLHLSENNFNYLKNHFVEWLIDLPFPLPDFNKVEHILLESKSWADDVDEEESMSDFYHISLQDIKDRLFTLNSRIDVLKESEAIDYAHDLTNAVAYLVRKLAFMEDQFYELNRPLTYELHMKMMNIKLNFESPENQPPIEKLPLEKRWLLYKAWVTDLYQFHTNQIGSLTSKSRDLNLRRIEIEELLNVKKIAQCDAEVIGMTTTAAAKYHKMLDCLKPKIVLVEEAAEVVEAHTVASLSKHCEHLILVGDHQQLRPLTSSYLIGKEAHLDISMYERLVRNGFPHCTLTTQYRMRPEIASLIAPSVYPDLINDHSVNELPHVLGVSVDLYFVNHSVKEDETPDIVSRWNRYEAEFHLALCNYLVKQGYHPSQITVLATYSEQEKYFNREKLNYPELEDVLMATVDSFQGKENDIILLSLVRSNAEGNIGFLGHKNRINVALSRAKRGLFITGNSKNLLAKGGLWHEVVDVLSRSNAIGSSLPLKCEVHGKLTQVTTPGAIRALKNGGCLRKCQEKLACGHKCIHLCHPMDRNHQEVFKCSSICDKVMACSHACILSCHIGNKMIRCFCKSCSPKTKCETKLPCGHTCKSMAHAEDIEHKAEFQCNEICDTVLKCGHTCSSLCHVEDIDHKKRYKCPIICEGILFCGHQCGNKSPKKHGCSTHKTTCVNTCAVEMPCGHICRQKCHNEDRSHERLFKCLQCGKNSSTKASTSFVDVTSPDSKNQASETSQTKKCPHGVSRNSSCDKVCGFKQKCGHRCSEKCHSTAEKHKQVCKEACAVLLTCGHRCQFVCHVSAPSLHKRVDVCQVCVEERVEKCSHGMISSCKKKCGFEYKCGHLCTKKCRHTSDVTHSKSCKQQCGQLFDCGHPCKKSCHFEEHPLNHLSCCKPCEENGKLSQQVKETSAPNVDTYQTRENDGKPASCVKNTCGFMYKCGHLCARKCQHSVDATHSKPCQQNCKQVLDCGHPCKLKCHFEYPSRHGNPRRKMGFFPPSSRCKVCKKNDDLNEQYLRTSNSDISESSNYKDNPDKCAHGRSLSSTCKAKCGFKYQCGHLCLKKCQHTADATHIRICKKPCDRLLACGHLCRLLCHLKASAQHELPSICAACKKTICPIASDP